jgi:saccharopine dehydrogenase-like NADP-dependent oxidoreductase
MRKILVIGSGKSTSYLIKHLLDKSTQEELHIIVGDINIGNAKRLIGDHENANAITLDVFDKSSRQAAIENADIVVSMLPARFHLEVAKDCVAFGKNMVTASYVSEDMQKLNKVVTDKGLVFMNEIGVDPGIDHMSAIKVIDNIRDKGGK